MEKLNHTSMTQAPLVVMDHSGLWKSFQPRNATFPFFYLVGSEMIRVALRWLEEAALGGFQPFQKSCSKEIGVDWGEKRNWKRRCAQRSPWPHRVSKGSQIESPKKLNIKCFSFLRFAVYHLGDFNQCLNKEFTFRDISQWWTLIKSFSSWHFHPLLSWFLFLRSFLRNPEKWVKKIRSPSPNIYNKIIKYEDR